MFVSFPPPPPTNSLWIFQLHFVYFIKERIWNLMCYFFILDLNCGFIRFWTSKVCFGFFSLITNFLRYVFFVLDITECHRIHIKRYSNRHHNTPKLTWLGLSKPTFTGNEHQPKFIINFINYTHTNSHKKLSNINQPKILNASKVALKQIH